MSGERGALRLSAFSCLGIGVAGLGFAAFTGSEAILLDGAFNLTYFALGLLTLKVVGLVESGEDERFPYGYGFFEPLVNGVKGVLVLGVSTMALFGAIGAVMEGGREISMGGAVVYGALATVACWTLAIVTRRASRAISTPLVRADAENWVVNAAVSSAVLAAFVSALVLKHLGQDALVPYVDPAIVIAVVLFSIGIPVRIAWSSLMGLLNRAAPPEVVGTARQCIEEALGDLPVRKLVVRVIQPGRAHMVTAHVLLETGRGPSLGELDTVRDRAGDALLEEDPLVVLDVIFTEDPRWFAELAPAA